MSVILLILLVKIQEKMTDVLLKIKEDHLQGQQTTNVQNVQFDLVSVAYHALEGATTYQKYAQDAQQGGDQELAQFFQQIAQQAASNGQMALQLLARRMGQSSSSYSR